MVRRLQENGHQVKDTYPMLMLGWLGWSIAVAMSRVKPPRDDRDDPFGDW
jgi:hypothetical protein